MNRKSTILLSLLIALFVLPKIMIVVLYENVPFGLNLYSICRLVHYGIYIYIFTLIYRMAVIKREELHLLLERLYRTAVVLLFNSLFLATVEIYSSVNLLRAALRVNSKLPVLLVIGNRVFYETDLFGYMTLSLAFFLIIYIYKNRVMEKQTEN